MSRVLENLESRLCLAATLNGGVLTITGTDGNDQIEVDLRDDGTLKVEINTVEQSFDPAAVSKFVVNALAGNDHVEFNDRNPISIPAQVFAGLGRDTVEGALGRDTIYGGGGNDSLDGEAGSDIIYGESGNDLIEGKNGNDKLFGGSGNDHIQGSIGRDTIVGGPGDDDLHGGTGTDQITGGSSNDDFDNSDSASEILDLTSIDSGANSLTIT